MKPNQNRLDSIRDRIGGSSSTRTTAGRLSRRDQEAQKQRTFRLAMIGVTALVLLILGIGLVYEYVVKPNQVLAEVNGHEITREDYWKYQSLALYNQARQYEAFAGQSAGEQQQQFLQFAASFDAQRGDVWGSTEVSGITLQQMVDDRLYLNGADALGITMSDQDVETFALNQFAPADAPLTTPIPQPTMIPERAQAATEAAQALVIDESTGLPVVPIASPVAANGSPAAIAMPIGPEGTPGATPVVEMPATPEATPDPQVMQDSLQAANAEFDLFEDEVFEDANLSRDEYMEIWARPRLARQLVTAELTNAVPQTGEQVNAQHIMVATEDLANQLYQQATGGADFAALARANSTDTLTQATGGQLGWFTRLEVTPAFADAAFALSPGDIGEPVFDGSAWHIIRVIERDDNRPLTNTQYQEATQHAIESWLEEQQVQASISSDHLPTPTPTTEAFMPPSGAPTPIPATPLPVTPTPEPPFIGPLPVAPGASPVAIPADGTPAAAATPLAEGTPVTEAPVATPVASPASSPAPIASPATGATPQA